MTSSPRRRRRRRPRNSVALLILITALGVLGPSACIFDQPIEVSGDRLTSREGAATAPTLRDVAYGDDPAQRLDVYEPRGRSVGTIVYFHSGGWVSGTKSDVAAIVMAQLERGWSIVSVGYRLAPEHRATELLGDADRALRYVSANAAELGSNTSTVVVAGTSAGGYLATMLAVAPGSFTESVLPPHLGDAAPRVDGLLNLAGPTDLRTLWQAGGLAPSLQTALLGCSAPGSPPEAGDRGAVPPTCDDDTMARFNPLARLRSAAASGNELPPAYFAYGAHDGLVVPETQGAPIAAAWQEAGGYARAPRTTSPQTLATTWTTT